jgi:hypothetical protein
MIMLGAVKIWWLAEALGRNWVSLNLIKLIYIYSEKFLSFIHKTSMKLSAPFLILLLLSVNSFSQIKKVLKLIQPTPDCCNFPINPSINFNPVSQTICTGSNVSFTASADPSDGHSWEMSTDNGLTWISSIGNSTTSGNNINMLTVSAVLAQMNGYQFRCYYHGACCGKAITTTATLTVANLPVQINSQPVNVSTCKNTSADFFVTVKGSSLSYQWQESTNGGNAFSDIPGKTTALLHFDLVNLSMNNNQCRCVIRSECSATVISSPAILTVRNENTVINNQIFDKTGCKEDTIILTTAATGNMVTYQWQNWNYSGYYYDLPGETFSALVIPYNDYLSRNYRCRIESTCKTLYTNAINIFFAERPIALSADDKYTCTGESIILSSFEYSASIGTSYHFQWQVSTDNGNTFTNITGDTLSEKSITASSAINNYKYRCYLNSTCFSGYSNTITVHVNVPVSILTQPQNKKACIGFPVTFGIKATGSINAYHWDQSSDGGNTFNRISDDATKSSFTIYNVSQSQNNYQYRCKISSNCFDTVISVPVTLNVYGIPEAGVDTSINVNCDSCTADIVALHDTTGYSAIQWGTANPENAKPGKYNFVVFNEPGCYDSAFNYVNVLIADTLRICYGGMMRLNAPAGGTTYQWQLDYGYGQGFNNVTDNEFSIFGSSSISLKLKGINTSIKARCIIDGIINNPIFIKITAYWTGLTNSDWNNPANWNCGQVPDYDTEVIIPGNAPNIPEVLNSTSCKKLTLQHSGIIIHPGRNLTIKGN